MSVAAVTSLGLVAGCGGGASSGEAPDRHSDSPSTNGATTAGTVDVESGIAQSPAERGREAGGARVQKAITGPTHSDRSGSDGSPANEESKNGQRHRGGGHGALSILDQLRRVARERLNALAPRKQGTSGKDDGLHILEMLR